VLEMLAGCGFSNEMSLQAAPGNAPAQQT